MPDALTQDERTALLWLRTGNACVEKFVDERPELGVARFRFNHRGPHAEKQIALVRAMSSLQAKGFVTIGPLCTKARRVTLTPAGEKALESANGGPR